jgi:uncharacterized lipoprotein YddW (UPF0748 family)
VAAARAERPTVLVSAAVVPDENAAVSQKYQSWPRWLADGLLDALCPMTYTPDSRIFKVQVEQARSRMRPGQALWAGIGAYRLSVEGTIERIRAARESGASGVVVFSHESFATADLPRLRQEAFPGPARAASLLSTGLGPGTK